MPPFGTGTWLFETQPLGTRDVWDLATWDPGPFRTRPFGTQGPFGIQGPFGAPPFGTQRLFGNNVIWDPGVIRGPAIWDPGPLGIRTIGELGTFATQGPLGPSHWGSGPTPRDLEQGLGILMGGKAFGIRGQAMPSFRDLGRSFWALGQSFCDLRQRFWELGRSFCDFCQRFWELGQSFCFRGLQ